MKQHATTLSRLVEKLRADVDELGTHPAARITRQSQSSIFRFQKHTAEPIVPTIDAVAHGLGYGFKLIRVRPAPSDPGTERQQARKGRGKDGSQKRRREQPSPGQKQP